MSKVLDMVEGEGMRSPECCPVCGDIMEPDDVTGEVRCLADHPSPDHYDTLFVQRGAEEAFRIVADDARKLRCEMARQKVQLCGAIDVIGFYGDPKTYTGIAIFADPPCGDFSKDYSRIGDDDRGRPGRRARDFLFGMEAEMDRRSALKAMEGT